MFDEVEKTKETDFFVLRIERPTVLPMAAKYWHRLAMNLSSGRKG